jgi:hypothetical protein
MIFTQVLIVIFAYTLNSVYPNEVITRFLLHTSLLLLVLNLLIERAKAKEVKKSNLAALSAIFVLIPCIFLGFLAEFYKLNYSSTKIFAYIFFGSILSFSTIIVLSKIKSIKWKQQLQLWLPFWFRKKI